MDIHHCRYLNNFAQRNRYLEMAHAAMYVIAARAVYEEFVINVGIAEYKLQRGL